ncbi:MAG: phosphotransferase [Chloroflexia bacterium]
MGGDALTLIHADFHGDHVRSRDGHAAIIDWEQARYGPLYTDPAELFQRDEALVYRDALAALGHDIPRERFLRGFDAASR